MARSEKLEGSEWQVWKGERVLRWQGGKGGRVVK